MCGIWECWFWPRSSTFLHAFPKFSAGICLAYLVLSLVAQPGYQEAFPNTQMSCIIGLEILYEWMLDESD
jgi:hypothetical protein